MILIYELVEFTFVKFLFKNPLKIKEKSMIGFWCFFFVFLVSGTKKENTVYANMFTVKWANQ